MKLVPSRPVRRLLAGLTPIVIVACALPLMAPTCGGFQAGVKTFAKGSMIIPMDVCYQCSTDGDSSTAPSSCGTTYTAPTGNGFASQPTYSCPQATDAGDVIKAYGLVYQLIRGGVPVYWIIDPAKASLNGIDLTVQYSGGPPVQRYDWSSGGSGTAPTSGTAIQYLGGPFIVDGSDYAAASAILQANKATFSAVKVHVANVAFQAPVARTMAGGWTAGGAVPPKLALLDIGSSIGGSSKNSEVVIRGYLIKAGLDFVGAGGTSAAGQHGQIYDRLTMADFLPDSTGLWTSTSLAKNGYQILWVPHWAAPGSCSDCTTSASTGSGTCPTSSCSCSIKYSTQNVSDSLKTIGAFYGSGHDVFAECAGLGSIEGVDGADNATPSLTPAQSTIYGSGDASTHFQTTAAGTGPSPSATTTGFWIHNQSVPISSTATFQGGYPSPFMQIGDFSFRPYTGAIENFRPTTYNANVVRFLTETTATTYDIFTMVPATVHTPLQAGDHGTSVYLGGHSFSGCDGSFQTAGTRLVLNSLFNLGASCVASGVACTVPGMLGVCAQGSMGCNATTGAQECQQTVFPTAEVCNGLDDNCNGLVDEGLSSGCYDGAAATRNVGLCHDGVKSCQKQSDGSYAMSACVGEQLPSAEVCDGLDNDCNGKVDDGLSQVCYDGPPNTLNGGVPMGICRTGTKSCTNGAWGTCVGEVLPLAFEYCGTDGTGDGLDNNCNGFVDEGCGCAANTSRSCYSGPAGTAGNGICAAGTQTCTSGVWGTCAGQSLPAALDCTKPDPTWSSTTLNTWLADPVRDSNCNGVKDYTESACNVCPATLPSCYDGTLTNLTVGDPLAPSTGALPVSDNATCKSGTRTCSAGVFGACTGQILPSAEVCDGKDNACTGHPDQVWDPATSTWVAVSCGAGFSCVNGVCVFSSCAAEVPCPDGYACTNVSTTTGIGTCTTVACGTGPACPSGNRCVNGACVDPCLNLKCAAGDVCAGGVCTGGSCYSTGCAAGLTCKNGACVADACTGVFCPAGTFCRSGDCVQACTWVTCPGGQRCGIDGFCVADPCAGVICAAGTTCDAHGACVKDPCAQLSCGTGQYCDGGACVDDPCAAITCPVGACWRGQCYPSYNPKGLGTVATPPPEKKASGCGCGGDASSPVLALFALLALPLARRRAARGPRGPGGLGGLAAILLAGGLTGLLAGCPASSVKAPDLSGCTETCGEQRCVDVRSDAAHCGTCANSCTSGQICVDGECGPGSAVAPYIQTLTPSSAAKGSTSVPIVIVGQRFQSGAKLRIINPPALPVTVATTYTDSGHLGATLDVSTDPVSTLYFRIVNPDNVISPVVPFNVVPVTPVVTTWTLDGSATLTAKVGPSPSTLHAVGSGLTTASQCHILSTTAGIDLALPTLNQTGTALDCTLDTSALSPGTYQLWVVNDGLLKSAVSTLTVTSDALSLTSLSPSFGPADAPPPAPPATDPGAKPVSVTVYGQGFNAGTVVFLSTTPGSTGTPSVAQTTTYLDPTRVLVQLNLNTYVTSGSTTTRTPLAAGDYNVQARNGTVNSNILAFSVVVNAATIASVSPASSYQGQTVTVTFTGTNFPQGATTIQVRKPDTTVASLTTTTTGCTSSLCTTASAALALLPTTSWPAGAYQLYLSFPTTTSSSFAFTVLSNVAILGSMTPAGEPQGSKVPDAAASPAIPQMSLSGANFFSGMRVFVLGLGGPGVDVEVAPVTVTSANAATAGNATTPLSLAGRDTGLYQVVARNTGAADSNALGFSVTPGPPTLTQINGVSPQATIARSTQCATANPPTTVTLTGTNFAKPDASGSGGSMVVAWNVALGLGTQAAPIIYPTSAVTVVSSTTIQVAVYTCQVLPSATQAYTVQIWNPGGPTPPQKSNFDLSILITP